MQILSRIIVTKIVENSVGREEMLKPGLAAGSVGGGTEPRAYWIQLHCCKLNGSVSFYLYYFCLLFFFGRRDGSTTTRRKTNRAIGGGYLLVSFIQVAAHLLAWQLSFSTARGASPCLWITSAFRNHTRLNFFFLIIFIINAQFLEIKQMFSCVAGLNRGLWVTHPSVVLHIFALWRPKGVGPAERFLVKDYPLLDTVENSTLMLQNRKIEAQYLCESACVPLKYIFTSLP